MKSPLKPSWKFFVVIIFFTGMITGGFHSTQLVREFSQIRELTGSPLAPSQAPRTGDGELKLLLQGDLTKGSEIARWKSVHDASPDSALHFSRYIQQAQIIPEGYAETIEKLAPSNGWFDVWEIAQVTSGSLRKADHPSDDDDDDESPDQAPLYEIQEPEALRQAIGLYHEAAGKEEFTSYFIEMQNLMQAGIGRPQTWLDEVDYRFKTLQITAPASVASALNDFTCAAFQFLIEKNDREGFLKFGHSSERLAPKLHADSHDGVGSLLTLVWLRNFYQQMIAGGKHFQVPEITRKYQDLWDRLQERDRKMSDQRDGPVSRNNRHVLRRHGAIMVQLGTGFNFTSRPIPFTRDDLRPSCRAENAMISRIFTTACFLLLLAIAIDLWIVSLRAPLSCQNEIADRLAQPGTSARWRTLTIGVILPFGILLAIRYLTPLGQLDFAATSSQFANLAIPLVASGLLIIATIIVIVRQLAESKPGSPIKLVIPLLLPLAAILIVGGYHALGRNSFFLLISGTANLAFLIWLAFIASRFHRQKEASKYLKARLAAPAFFLAAGLFGIWTRALVEEEKYWIANDEFGTPKAHFITKYEAKMTRNFLSELKALLP